MSGYCKHCDTIIEDNSIVRAYDDNHRLVWSGCLSCYDKRNELIRRNETITK